VQQCEQSNADERCQAGGVTVLHQLSGGVAHRLLKILCTVWAGSTLRHAGSKCWLKPKCTACINRAGEACKNRVQMCGVLCGACETASVMSTQG
jgi:hypothetical protein